MTFEWDENKNAINKKKHGVDFSEASSVFYDDNAIMFDDPDHSEEEDHRNDGNDVVVFLFHTDFIWLLYTFPKSLANIQKIFNTDTYLYN